MKTYRIVFGKVGSEQINKEDVFPVYLFARYDIKNKATATNFFLTEGSESTEGLNCFYFDVKCSDVAIEQVRFFAYGFRAAKNATYSINIRSVAVL